MAIVNDNINYYNKSVVDVIKSWNIMSQASVSGEYVNIQSGGYIGVELTNDLYNGLKACRHRKINIQVRATVDQYNNYTNDVEALLKVKYKSNEDEILVELISVNFTLLSSQYDPYLGILKFSRVIEMENYDLAEATLYIINHSTNQIQMQYCAMYRSQDVSGSQIGESIGWGITLAKCIAYLDGCELYYEGNETPDKLWYMEDQDGNFSGINVNNERLIKFERRNEYLFD